MSVTSRNPATGDEHVLDIDETSAEEVARLAGLARDAAPDVASRPLAWRAQLLVALADELDAAAPDLVDLAMRETALTRARLEGELRRTSFQLRFFAQVVLEGSFLEASIDHACESPMGPLPDLRRMNVPLGPVGVFGSSNFPFAFSVPGGDTASALAAGCPVVIKAHPAHPATSQACFDALRRGASRVDAPPGLLGLVFGLSAGAALVDDPSITAVGFTGSVAAGRALWRRANERPVPIPFYGELGAANPLVVSPRAAAARAGEIGRGIAGSVTLGVGQFCTKPGLVFVPSTDGGDDVVAALVEATGELSPMTMLSSGIAEHFRAGLGALRELPLCRQLVVGADGDDAQVAAQLFEVRADDFATSSARALREECFGPTALVIRYDGRDDLGRALDGTDPALTFSVFLEDDDDESWLVEYGPAKAGRVIVNGYPTGVGVSWSMQHGGPWPSATVPWATSVGAGAISRWLRPVSFQGVAQRLLPAVLRDDSSLGVPRRVDGVLEGG